MSLLDSQPRDIQTETLPNGRVISANVQDLLMIVKLNSHYHAHQLLRHTVFLIPFKDFPEDIERLREFASDYFQELENQARGGELSNKNPDPAIVLSSFLIVLPPVVYYLILYLFLQ